MPFPAFPEDPLFQFAPMAMLAIDEDHRIVGWNRAAEALTGHRMQDIRGREARVLLPEPIWAMAREHWAALFRGGTEIVRLPLFLCHKDGTLIWVWSEARAYVSQGRHFVLVALTAGPRPYRTRPTPSPEEWPQTLAARLYDLVRACVEDADADAAWLLLVQEGTVQVLVRYPDTAPDPQESPFLRDRITALARNEIIPIQCPLVDAGRFWGWFPVRLARGGWAVLMLQGNRPFYGLPFGERYFVFAARLAALELTREQERQEEQEVHERLTRVVQYLNAEPNIFARFPDIAEDLKALAECDRVSIALLNPDNTFTMVALDKPDVALTQGVTLPASLSAAAEDVLAGRPHLTPDLVQEQDKPAERALYEAGYRSRINLPLVVEGEVVGALNFAWKRPHGWREERVLLLEQVAAALAQALARSRVLEREHRQRRIMETVYTLAKALREAENEKDVFSPVLETLMDTLDADGAAVLIWDERQQRLVIPAGTGILAWCTAKEYTLPQNAMGAYGQTIWHTDNADRERPHLPPPFREGQTPLGPLLSIPIALEKEGPSLGLLVLVRQPGRPAFPTDVFPHLSLFGEILAVTLSRLRLFRETQEWQSLLRALHTMDRLLLKHTQAALLFRMVLLVGQRLLGAEAAMILRRVSDDLWRVDDILGCTIATDVPQYLSSTHAERLNRIWQSGSIYVYTEADTPGFASWCRESGLTHWAALPVPTRQHPPIVLFLAARKPFPLSEVWHRRANALRDELAVGLDHITAITELQNLTRILERAYDSIIFLLGRAVEMRDVDTEDHTRRVADLTVRLARKLGVPEDEIVHIYRGALLHDVGKLAIPDRILLKPGPLTEEEWAVMRMHPVLAYEMLKHIPFLEKALDIPYCHHERWDGSGYPRGLRGEDIPLAARIFAVVDVWDALTHDRPYRPAWPKQEALRYLKEKAGKLFDPKVVEAFLELLVEEEVVHRKDLEEAFRMPESSTSPPSSPRAKPSAQTEANARTAFPADTSPAPV